VALAGTAFIAVSHGLGFGAVALAGVMLAGSRPRRAAPQLAEVREPESVR
jgi:hypothetical protein